MYIVYVAQYVHLYTGSSLYNVQRCTDIQFVQNGMLCNVHYVHCTVYTVHIVQLNTLHNCTRSTVYIVRRTLYTFVHQYTALQKDDCNNARQPPFGFICYIMANNSDVFTL